MKMQLWLIYAIGTAVLWGIWGFFPKLASMHINDARSILIYQGIGIVIVTLIALASIRFQPKFDVLGFTFAILAGLAVTIGQLLFISAVSKHSTPVVISITALYPLVTIFLSMLILHETVTIRQGVGIVLAITAMILLSI